MADSKEMIMATGRRKCAVAVVKLVKGKGRIFVNGKTLQAYIGNMPAVEMMVYRPLVLTENQEKYDVRVKAVGGGIVAQAAAIGHGISRALLKSNEEYKAIDYIIRNNLNVSATDRYINSLLSPKTKHKQNKNRNDNSIFFI